MSVLYSEISSRTIDVRQLPFSMKKIFHRKVFYICIFLYHFSKRVTNWPFSPAFLDFKPIFGFIMLIDFSF